MEWLNDGQHVQKYAIEAWDGKVDQLAAIFIAFLNGVPATPAPA